MKITTISLYQVELPIIDGYQFAKGKRVDTADSTVVRIDTNAGLSGWGEATPLGPFYLAAYAAGVRTGIAALAPHLIGRDPLRLGELNAVMDRELKGHPYVKSPIDVACWDLLGQAAGLPVHALLGGRCQDSAPLYWSVTQGEPDTMRRMTAEARDKGYKIIQLKVGGDPVEDIARVQAGMADAQAGEIFLCDANTGWTRMEALEVARRTAELNYILEQPCALYGDCLAVRRRAPQAFKLDESLQSIEDVQRALHDDACDVACIKITKQGGLSKARLVRDLCAAQGIPMTVEDVWGGDVAAAAVGHLAISTPPECLLNTTDLNNYHSVHVARGMPEPLAGRLRVSDTPGLGIEVDEAALGEPHAVYP